MWSISRPVALVVSMFSASARNLGGDGQDRQLR
jgi:hypothetical protein